MCLLLPALLPVAAELQAFGQDKPLPSGAFSFDKAPMHVANNNAQVRMMLRGKLATGEGIEVHQTTLPPDGAPTATTHHHPHSEMWLIREGTIELTVIDKKFLLEPLIGWVCRLERRARNQECGHKACYVLCGRDWTGRRVAGVDFADCMRPGS
jgi:hypothetical protein